MYGGKGKAKGTVDQNEPLFKGVWQIYLNEALEMAGYQSLRDIPRNITQPAQILLAALLITADWLASNTAFCPLIAADTLLNKNMYPARSTRAISMIDLPKPWQLNDEWRYYDLCSARFDFEQPNAIKRFGYSREFFRRHSPAIVGNGYTYAIILPYFCYSHICAS